jgi:hypothetical protein
MRTLPVGQTVRHIFSSTFNNLGFALRAQWPWMVIVACVFAFTGAVAPEFFDQDTKQLETFFEIHPERAGMFFLAMLLCVIVGMLAFSSCAVAWHRYVLLDEVPKGLAKLRVDGTVWRYLGNLILISLILLLVIIPLALMSAILFELGTVFSIIVFLAYSIVVVMPILYRLSIKLPAIALGRHDFKMRDALSATSDNWWQIIGVGLVVSILSWVSGVVLKLFSKFFVAVLGDVAAFWPDLVAQTGINWVITIMGITLLTSLYGFFVEKREF